MKSFLIWVGSAHYRSIVEYSSEAIVQGISKRLPNLASAKAVMGATIFLAHDEGEKSDCPKCLGDVDCPECRKIANDVENVKRRVKKLKDSLGETEPSKSQARTLALCEKTIERAVEAMASCEECDGLGHVKSGTGGSAVLKNGEVWDYRRYTYWRNSAKLDVFDFKTDVEVLDMCENCGGFGTLPKGKVFGLFVPERIEYITAPDDDEARLAEIAEFARVVSPEGLAGEGERKCGRRKEGGAYVVTSPRGKKSKEALKALKAIGMPETGVELHGAFVRFLDPVDITERRFRGIKRWDYAPAAAVEAASDVIEALA